MKEMYQLITLVTTRLDDVKKLDVESLQQLMKMGAKVQKLLEMKNKLAVVVGGKNKS
jgi:DNA-binding transcriptional regulator GbsR (MarR family)